MDIADQKYISFTTFRRDGRAVSSPVWVARLSDGRVGFTTDATAGKVKRLRNNPAVTMRACNMKGKVADGAAEVSGTAEVVTGAQYDEVWGAVRRKYWLFANAMHVFGKIRTLGRPPKLEPTAVIVRLD
jgi:uncharacterized protein